MVDDMTAFQNLAMQDSTDLQACHTAVTNALDTEVGNLAQLKKNLSDDRALLKADQAAYLHGKPQPTLVPAYRSPPY